MTKWSNSLASSPAKYSLILTALSLGFLSLLVSQALIYHMDLQKLRSLWEHKYDILTYNRFSDYEMTERSNQQLANGIVSGPYNEGQSAKVWVGLLAVTTK